MTVDLLCVLCKDINTFTVSQCQGHATPCLSQGRTTIAARFDITVPSITVTLLTNVLWY